MANTYSPRGMPSRFMAGAPEIVRKGVIDLIRIEPAAPLDFDVIFRDCVNPADPVSRHEWQGLDFGQHGARGCHFSMSAPDMRAYRERNRRKRVAWRDLPAATQSAIVAYLES